MFSKFIFKNEGESGLLDDFAIATQFVYYFHMEYFADYTFELAKRRKLKNKKKSRERVLKMLQDPRADRFAQ